MLLISLSAAVLVALQPAPVAGTSATLVPPRVLEATLDGRRWSCDPQGACLGRGGGTTQPLMRECRRFVARVGRVSAYARQGLALTQAEIAQCNAGAGR